MRNSLDLENFNFSDSYTKYSERFAKIFGELISISNVKYEDLAKLLNLTKGTISKYKNGLTLPTNVIEKIIAEVFSISPALFHDFDMTVADALSQKKHDNELEIMKKDIELLKKGMGSESSQVKQEATLLINSLSDEAVSKVIQLIKTFDLK